MCIRDPISTETAFYAEAFGTAALAFVIFALTHQNNDTMKNQVYIPPLIGMTVGGLISVFAPISQAGFNPARDFGPRIVAYAAGWGAISFQGWWVYVFAPLVGAPIGAAIADFLLYGETPCAGCSTWTAAGSC
jgi:glycerol uptake facilitator protein